MLESGLWFGDEQYTQIREERASRPQADHEHFRNDPKAALRKPRFDIVNGGLNQLDPSRQNDDHLRNAGL